MLPDLNLTKQGGVGKPILLLHGIMGSGNEFSEIVPWLSAKRTVYTIDLPLHRGEKDKAITEIDLNLFLADIGQAIFTIDKGPVTLLGHSMGAALSWCFTAKHPELVDSLILEDMAPDLTQIKIKSGFVLIKRLFSEKSALPLMEFKSISEKLVGKIATTYFINSLCVYENPSGYIYIKPHGNLANWEKLEKFFNEHKFWEEWKQITKPTLLLSADNTFIPRNQLKKMTELNPKAIYCEIPESTHIIHRSNPWGYRGAVEAFLNRNK